jgi:ABC-type branched-subunit amino acid transport system substrate-binding protein
MKKYTLLSLVLVIAMVAGLAVGVWAKGEKPVKTLRIGSLLCLTGWWSVDDVLQQKELNATAKYINDHGGITVQGQKYKIQLVTEDGQSTMDGVAAAARKLIYDDNVKFIAGPTALWPFGSSPIFSKADVMDVVSYAGNAPGNMDASTPNTFLAGGGTLGSMEAAVAVLKKYYPNTKSAVVMRPDDGNTPYIEGAMKKVLANAGIHWAGFVTYSNTTTDFSPTASKLHAIKADAIVHIDSNAVMIASIVKDLRGLGDNRPYITGVDCPLSDIIQIAGIDVCHDVSTTDAGMNVAGNPPQLNAVINTLAQENGGKAPSLVLLNANALYALVSVIKAANSLDPAKVRAQWLKMKTIDTLFGPGIVSGTKTFGIADHALTMPYPYQIVQKGKVVSGWVTVPPIS